MSGVLVLDSSHGAPAPALAKPVSRGPNIMGTSQAVQSRAMFIPPHDGPHAYEATVDDLQHPHHKAHANVMELAPMSNSSGVHNPSAFQGLSQSRFGGQGQEQVQVRLQNQAPVLRASVSAADRPVLLASAPRGYPHEGHAAPQGFGRQASKYGFE